MFVCQFALCVGEMRARVPALSFVPRVCLSARRNVCASLFFVVFLFFPPFSGLGGGVVRLLLVRIQI